jgi:hypothetical protein
VATTFMEPGGDADFAITVLGSGGMWGATSGSPVLATDFVHGSHIKSLKFPTGTNCWVGTPVGSLADTGTRISVYIYMVSLPSGGDANVFSLNGSGGGALAFIRVKTTGVLYFSNAGGTQIGANGPTLSTGTWYRVCLSYTIAAQNVNRFEVFVDGVSKISVTNATLFFGTSLSRIGNIGGSTQDFRFSDIYIDDSAALTDTGNIWVTAKRPNANGALNEWTTQIGSGGSGYGSGHSPQINERPYSATNGWSIQDPAKKTEQFTIESSTQGDIDLTGATLKDFMGWAVVKVGVASTGNIILAGTATNISVTTAFTMFKKVLGSTTYPSGTNAIGVDTNTVNQLFSLAECGILVAYIPPIPTMIYSNLESMNRGMFRGMSIA